MSRFVIYVILICSWVVSWSCFRLVSLTCVLIVSMYRPSLGRVLIVSCCFLAYVVLCHPWCLDCVLVVSWSCLWLVSWLCLELCLDVFLDFVSWLRIALCRALQISAHFRDNIPLHLLFDPLEIVRRKQLYFGPCSILPCSWGHDVLIVSWLWLVVFWIVSCFVTHCVSVVSRLLSCCIAYNALTVFWYVLLCVLPCSLWCLDCVFSVSWLCVALCHPYGV